MRGGVRQRLESLHHEEAHSPKRARNTGGVRQRQRCDASGSNDGGGVGHMPQGDANGRLTGPDLPLNNKLLGRWVKGKINSKDVLELASCAQTQGTPGMGRLATTECTDKSRNHNRNLMAAIGYPEKSATNAFH